ncbi:MAG: 2-amino-4-hydroxy-6-hydroxymethyldihydropteridine diphosphokinase [Candidatus Pacebacteria bacterium]|nr:2-amino-4-hydroxy-6-hydroxymethyldihydropteridine diphosphokinase [Candidatus Paceibacterota bacterium]
MATVYIGLGSNLGHREANLEQAMRLCRPEFQITKVSSVYETEMMYRRERPRYFNLVCRVETHLTPIEAHAKCKAIERSLGRKVTGMFDPRTIDVVLLMYETLSIKSGPVTVPHPRLHERAFVLVPFAEIAPNLVHPELNTTIAELKGLLGDYSQKIVKIDQAV